jgi:hypothetical protein
MTEKQKDTILNAKIWDIGSVRGVLLNVKERKHLIQPIQHSGMMWFDLETAHELELVPPNYRAMNDTTLNGWLIHNIIGNAISIYSFSKVGVTPKLEAQFRECLELAKVVIPSQVENLRGFITLVQEVKSEDELFKKVTREIVMIPVFSPPPHDAKIIKLYNEFWDKFTLFYRNLIYHYGFKIEPIIPPINEPPDLRYHQVVSTIKWENGSFFSLGNIVSQVKAGKGHMEGSTFVVDEKAQVIIAR